MITGPQYAANWKVLCEEIDKLDSRDFEPQFQPEFLTLKAELIDKPVNPQPGTTQSKTLLEKLLAVLDGYKGEGSRAVARSFDYIADADLRRIIERDYLELTLKLFPSHAWKSTVIMAGSILEAMLTDILTEPSRMSATLASPKRPTKGDITKGEWKLEKLIDVAEDTGILPTNRAKTIDQVLRDYRNFVHPKKEIRSQHECSEAEGGLAKFCLDGVCDHLERTL
jgi:hypothetical protein